MTMFLLMLALVAQQPQAQPPLRSDTPPSRELSAGSDIFVEDEQRMLTPAALRANQEFGSCVASRSPEEASRVLRMDHTGTSYRNGLRQLARNNESCFRARRGRMRASGLPFAGAIAEALIERDAAPLNVRIARASAAGASVPAFAPADRVFACVVRSVPDDAATLLATEPGSDAEAAAAGALQPALALCARGGPSIQTPTAGVRALVAATAFRLLHSTGAQAARSN